LSKGMVLNGLYNCTQAIIQHCR